MLRADLQEEHSAAQRQDPAGEGAELVPVQDPGVVRDGDTYYLVINNLGEQCLRRTFHWLTVLFPLCDLEGNEWEEHPKYCLTGEGNSVATKGASTVYSPWHDWASTLVTNRVMDSGIHRISLVYTVPTLETMSMMLGFPVLQPGAVFSL